MTNAINHPNAVAEADNLHAKAEDFQARFDHILAAHSLECWNPSLVVDAEAERHGITPYRMMLAGWDERPVDVRGNIPAEVGAELRRRAANLLKAADAIEAAANPEA